MKKLLVLALAVVLTPIAAAKVWVTVYRCDGKTPLAAVDSNQPDVYRDIMVGTRLALVISSDTSNAWGGTLEIPQDYTPYGVLSGRGGTPPSPSDGLWVPMYQGSCLDGAGTNATVFDFADIISIGFIFSNDVRSRRSSGHPAYPGDWFIVDYYAEAVGDCTVESYALGPVGPVVNPAIAPVVGPPTLLQTLSFTHVPSRDFNGDTVVNLKDFAVFASRWRSAADPNASAGAACDLNADRWMDGSDLAAFTQYWLERTDCNEPPASPDPATTL